MLQVKKLIFTPLFLVVFVFLLFRLEPFLKSYDVIFSLSITSLIELIFLAFLITLTGFLFVLSSTFAGSWKLILPAILVGALLPPIILGSVGIVVAIGTLAAFSVSFINLQNRLKTYLNFEPASLFGPSIRGLTSFLIVVFSIGYFLSISKVIQEQGFQIPDSIIDQTLKFTGQSQSYVQDTLKDAVKNQLEGAVKPYLGILPAILALLFFFVLQSLTSLLNLLIYPLLWVSFNIMEKTKFITFTEEQRTVRKMVV